MVVFRMASPVPKIGALRAKLSSAQALTHGSHNIFLQSLRTFANKREVSYLAYILRH